MSPKRRTAAGSRKERPKAVKQTAKLAPKLAPKQTAKKAAKRSTGRKAGRGRPRDTAEVIRRGRPVRRPRRPNRTAPKAALPAVGSTERVLGLDISSRCVGWALFVGGVLAAHGRYRHRGTGHGERLAHFGPWLTTLLSELEPTQVAYEAPYSGRMRHTFGVLSKYVGVVESVHFSVYGAEIPPENAVAAHAVKRAIGARKGRDHEENKRIVLLLVNQVFGLALKYKDHDDTKRVSEDDEADAIAVAWAWHLLCRTAPALEPTPEVLATTGAPADDGDEADA